MNRTDVTITGDEFYLVLDVHDLGLTDDQYFRLCRDNDDLRIEMSAQGELIIMSPNKPKTGRKHAVIIQRLRNWAERDGTGEVFDATSEFTLPNGAKRMPDASWILKLRWDSLTEEQQEDFSPICPDFVIEVRSPRDRLKVLKAKMEEYRDNGACLGWLLDPIANRGYIYLPGASVQEIEKPEILRGDPILPGFTFDFREIL
ncbi:MAG TPA: Uma2 family endonuclease [Terriglobia bacterium]